MIDNEVSSSSSSSAGEQSTAAAIVSGWFWQAAEGHNYRWSKAVRSITRYYESAPLEGDILKLVIEYLRTMTGVTGIELNHKLYQPGGTWATKDAWFQTVPGDKWEGTQSTKVRIYQTLICQADGEADGPYTVENGCRYLVKHTFYWDVAETPTVPAGTSGVSYTLQGITRDRETGLFSCVLEKRERVEQDIALYDSVKTIFEKRQEAQYLGVKQDDVSGKGAAASASGGVLVERRLTKNEDCTTNIENVITTEESVNDATVEYRKTLRGTIKTKADRGQAAALEQSGMVVGETRRSEKTPGGLYNNTTVKATNEAAGKIASSCQKTIFEHEHQKVENVISEPSESAATASGGVVHTKQIRKTEEGTFDVTTTDRTEASVDDATVEYRKTTKSIVTTTIDRGQAAALDQSGMVVGETRRSEKTPGGLFNNTTVVISSVAAKIASACVRSGGGFMHQHQTTYNVESEPSSSDSSASVNYQRQRTVQRTEEGWRVESTVTKWESEADSESWSDDTYNYKHVTYINQKSPLIPVSGENISCSFSMNGHGSFDGSYTVRNGKTSGEGSTLQWSIGPSDIEGKYYYFKKNGKLYSRLYHGQVYRCGGKKQHVANEIQTKQSEGWTGFPPLGWRTAVGGSYMNAEGEAYKIDSVDAEVLEDDSSGD